MTAVPRPIRLRPWRIEDVPALRAAIDESLPEVQRWLPWGREEPSTLEQLTARLDVHIADLEAGRIWRLAMVDAGDGTLLGSAALLPGTSPEWFEVGYWARTSAAGQGLATRAAAALVRHAFLQRGARWMELWTLVGNEPSMAVARRMGFSWRETRVTERRGAPTETFEIFEMRGLHELRVPDDPHIQVELG